MGRGKSGNSLFEILVGIIFFSGVILYLIIHALVIILAIFAPIAIFGLMHLLFERMDWYFDKQIVVFSTYIILGILTVTGWGTLWNNYYGVDMSIKNVAEQGRQDMQQLSSVGTGSITGNQNPVGKIVDNVFNQMNTKK